MAYGLSNGQVTDDVTWPWKVKLVTPIHLERNISKTTWARDFKFDTRLCIGMPSRHTNNFPESGRGLGHVTFTIFGSTVAYPSDSLASCQSPYAKVYHKRKVIRPRLLLTINKKLQIGCQMSIGIIDDLGDLEIHHARFFLGAFVHTHLPLRQLDFLLSFLLLVGRLWCLPKFTELRFSLHIL